MTKYLAAKTNVYYGPPASILAAAYAEHGDVDCTPDPHPILNFNIFYPDESVAGPMPASGWPVAMFAELSGFIQGTTLDEINPIQSWQHPILENGIALVYAQLPVARGPTIAPLGTNTAPAATVITTAGVAASDAVPFTLNIQSPSSDFDGGGGDIMINGEKMYFDGKSATTMNITMRAMDGTVAADHAIGDAVTEAYNADLLQWGPPYRGNGCHPFSNPNQDPDLQFPGPFPDGYRDDYPDRPHPWLDPLWINPCKAAMWLVQFLKYNGIGGPGRSADRLKINPGRIGCAGNSATAIAWAWPAYQPNRAGLTGMGMEGMGAMNTRIRAGTFRQCTSYWPVYIPAVPPAGPVGYMFAQRPFVSGNNDYDTPASHLGEVDTDLSTRGAAGVDFYGSAEASSPGITAANNAFPAWWSSFDGVYPNGQNPNVLNKVGRYTPGGPAANGQEDRPHSLFGSYRAKARFPSITLVVEDAAHVDADAETTGGGYLPDKVIATSTNDVYQDSADFLALNLALPVPVEEQVQQAIETRLRTITQENGYVTDVKGVYRREDQPASVINSPCVMTDFIKTQVDDQFEANVIRKTAAIFLTLYLEGWENQQARISDFIADVEQALYSDITMGGAVGIENMHLRSTNRILLDEDGHEWAAAELSLDVIFRHTIGDPFTVHPYHAST